MDAVKAREMRFLYAAGYYVHDLAAEYKISPGQASRILRGEAWPDAGGPLKPKGTRRRLRRDMSGQNNPGSRYTPQDYALVAALRKEGHTHKVISGATGISKAQVSRILRQQGENA